MGRTVRTCLQQYPLILGRGTVGQAANEPWLGAFVGFSLKCLLVSNMGKNPAVLEGPPLQASTAHDVSIAPPCPRPPARGGSPFQVPGIHILEVHLGPWGLWSLLSSLSSRDMRGSGGQTTAAFYPLKGLSFEQEPTCLGGMPERGGASAL